MKRARKPLKGAKVVYRDYTANKKGKPATVEHIEDDLLTLKLEDGSIVQHIAFSEERVAGTWGWT